MKKKKKKKKKKIATSLFCIPPTLSARHPKRSVRTMEASASLEALSAVT